MRVFALETLLETLLDEEPEQKFQDNVSDPVSIR